MDESAIAYTLLIINKNIEINEIITRNHLSDIKDFKSARTL
jgi:hypothetical protein